MIDTKVHLQMRNLNELERGWLPVKLQIYQASERKKKNMMALDKIGKKTGAGISKAKINLGEMKNRTSRLFLVFFLQKKNFEKKIMCGGY